MALANQRAYLAWVKAAGPYWQFLAATPFYGTTSRPLRGPVDLAGRIAGQEILPYFPPGPARTALLVDLKPEIGIAMTPALHRAGFLVVPTIYRWEMGNPFMPARRLLGELIWHSQHLSPPAGPRGVAFLLDGERWGPSPNLTVPRGLFDNRYDYPADTFPPVHILNGWGVTELGLVIDRGAPLDDVAEITQKLVEEGLACRTVRSLLAEAQP